MFVYLRVLLEYCTVSCCCRFDKEQLARQEECDKADTLKKKMDFNTKIYDQVHVGEVVIVKGVKT